MPVLDGGGNEEEEKIIKGQRRARSIKEERTMNSQGHLSQASYKKPQKSALDLPTKNESTSLQENDSTCAKTNCIPSRDGLSKAKSAQKRYSSVRISSRNVHQTTTVNDSWQIFDATNWDLSEMSLSQIKESLMQQITACVVDGTVESIREKMDEKIEIPGCHRLFCPMPTIHKFVDCIAPHALLRTS